MSTPPCPRTPTQSFTPKPFPPPALRNVPEAYIVSQLHRLAPNYWYKPETADCTIIVPCDVTRRSNAQPPDPDPLATGPFSDPSRASGRDRDNESPRNSRRMVLKLHQDYLSAQSTFMRTLFSGSSPLDLSSSVPPLPTPPVSATTSQFPPHQPTSPFAAGTFPVHPSRRPRVLPSSGSHHPVIFLPVPDPTSFPHLVHYLYFGTFDYIEECLHRGIITWQGIVRNVEYFGMRLELKASLGRYYRQWLRPNFPQEPWTLDVPAEDSDDDGNSSDSSSCSEASLDSGACERQERHDEQHASPSPPTT